MEELKLKPEELTCRCSDEDVALTGTAPPTEQPVLPGQARAVEAVVFGLGLKKPYFNITVSGVSRSGKTTLVEQICRARAKNEPPGRDICFLPNFSEPHRPQVVYLLPGSAAQLNRLLDELLKTLDKQIPNLLDQPSVKAVMQQISESFDRRLQAISREIEQTAAENNIFVQTTQQGVNLIPLKDGKPITHEQFISLSAEEREAIDRQRRNVFSRMAEQNPRVMDLEKERRDTVEQFLSNSIRHVVHGYVTGIRQRMEENPKLTAFFSALEDELVEKRFLFLPESSGLQPFGGLELQVMRQHFARNCRVNGIVQRGNAEGAPVIVEINPTFNNLIGGVDFVEERGVLKTDFMQIRAGSLLHASGGYLIIQAHDLLQYPFSYAALKRALRAEQVTLRDQFTELGLRSGAHLEPEAVKVDAKVILIGDDYLIQMMHSLDDEFAGLFKIHADFSPAFDRTPEATDAMVRYLAYHAHRHKLLPLSNGAVARVIEEASRRVGHQNRLSGQVNELMDILIEADQLARKDGQPTLTRAVVHEALKHKHARHARIEDLVKREIREGTILLDFDGAKVGQVNGLAVYQVGRVSFGIPARITAQAYAGRRGIINIEREAELSGAIHTKGLLILNGYLGKLFARRQPLALSVSVCFEQSYGGIEGDSATAAEFFAILSAISQVPIRQSIAVTGSMNQHGEIQPIGGVNEKITGFFHFIKDRGFPPGAGVIIPAVNRVNLLLDDEIIAAVREGRFNIHPIRRIEEGLAVITGLPAGEPLGEGAFAPDTVYGRAQAKLQEFSESARAGEHDRGSAAAQ
jgi:lon-related putative ATP-dependent protease